MSTPRARSSRVFTVSFPEPLAQQVEKVAREENRNISELFREAFRTYKSRKSSSDLKPRGPFFLQTRRASLRRRSRHTSTKSEVRCIPAESPSLIVVLDSNVWISALHFGGIPLEALRKAYISDRIAYCVEIETEVQRTLVTKLNCRPQRNLP